MDCLFCKIIDGSIPSKKVYEDEKIYAFLDIAPEAPTHFLVIPKEHIASADDVNDENSKVIAHIFAKIPKICKDLGVENGYRIVNNCGADGGQTVSHMHFHVLAGRNLSWPPG
ncbi:MAG: histidine triad nucleotide-binding protein [Clostridia bacterium]